MSSRLARDSRGRLFVEIVIPRTPGERASDRLLVLGNAFEAGGNGIGFLGAPTGRAPEPQERAAKRSAEVNGTPRQAWPADYPDRARELHAGGLSCPKVAEELGVPFATAKFWIWPPASSARPPAGLRR